LAREQEQQRRQRDLASRRAVLEAQIKALQHEASTLDAEIAHESIQYASATDTIERERRAAARRRGGEESA
jgi:hypothetical protein